MLAIVIIGVTLAGTGLAQEQVVSSKPQLRVLTYNIHHGEAMDGKFDYPRLSKVITDLKPDVVALQEVDCKTKRSRGVDQAEVLRQLTNMNAAFGQAMPYQGGRYGEAILSRFAMMHTATHPLPYRPGQEPRAAIAARIKPDNGLPEFTFVGTHLCHQSEETRIEQAQQININFPAGGAVPIIVAGDLNARPGSAPMKTLLEKRWTDVISPKSRIDYVLIRPEDPWKVVNVIIVDEPVVSDHPPVLAVLEWIGPKAKSENSKREFIKK